MASVPVPMPVIPTGAAQTRSAISSLGHDQAGGPVGHGADVEHGQRSGHHLGRAHVVHGEPRRVLSVGVVEGVGVVLDRDLGHLLGGRAELVHVPAHHHGVVAGVEAAHGEVEVGVGGQGDELVALPGVHVAHRLEAHDQAAVHAARGHVLVGVLEVQTPGGAAALDAREGLGHMPR